MEQLIRLQADNAQKLQRLITSDEDVEKWVSDGHWDFLERRVLADVEKEAFQTIKNPAFDPANLSQVAQLKALCQVIDILRNKIMSRVNAIKDARALLNDLQNSTLKEGE